MSSSAIPAEPTSYPAPFLPNGFAVGSEGGDSLTMNVNDPFADVWYHTVYMMFCTVVVFMIIPGIALLYGGLARRKAAASLLFLCFGVIAIGSFQWLLWGYSLAFSSTATGSFYGNLDMVGLRNVFAAPIGYLPEPVYVMYELEFALCTSMLAVGGAFERARLLPILVYVFIFQTLIYSPICHWTWTTVGWLNKLGALDFAGGGPVHMASGSAGLAFSLMLGHRHEIGSGKRVPFHKPHNVTLVVIGTSLIFTGWFGFNGGSDLSLNIRAVMAFTNTGNAAAAGVLGWMLMDKIFRKRFSVTGACCGVIAGLVGITPAAGYVPIWASWIIGFVTAIVCSSCGFINALLRIDDGLDTFKMHAIGGMCGAVMTGIFAADYIAAADGSSIPGGWISGNFVQLGYQIVEILAICSWSFTITCISLLIMKYIPGLHLRIELEDELKGIDGAELLEETVGDWTMMHSDQQRLDHNPAATSTFIGEVPPSSEGSIEQGDKK